MEPTAPPSVPPDATRTDDDRPPRPWPWLPAALALAGVILFIFATHGPPASSSGFVSLAQGLLRPVAPDYVDANPHYTALPGPGSWLFAFVLGMGGGGWLSRATTRAPVDDVPQLWRRRHGPRRTRRCVATFCGGALILFASRLAGGCTLGLFISGVTQLAVSGLVFGVLIFAAAMITARVVYGGGRKEAA